MLVAESRGARHRGNELATDLSRDRFDGERYAFQILVETVDSAQNYADRLTEIFTDAITLYETADLRRLKRAVLTNA
ncbi:hypothetical protein [Natrononativus amylolyticus]|uniref:hypothetical protein n=1 Tax=Natrononativus amylolyticus TaxID=2963434 RepID=UPI0020CF46C3|nr:hypothetical protein [Natrononativus amylolyticus]